VSGEFLQVIALVAPIFQSITMHVYDFIRLDEMEQAEAVWSE